MSRKPSRSEASPRKRPSSKPNSPRSNNLEAIPSIQHSFSLATASDWRRLDKSYQMNVMRRLEETGEKDRLIRNLRAQLIESGWRDEMKEIARDTIRNQGLSKVTVDELVAEVLPRGKASVPEDIKANLLESVRNFVRHETSADNNNNPNSGSNNGYALGRDYRRKGGGYGGTSDL